MAMSSVNYNFSIFFTIVQDFEDLCGTQANPVRIPELDKCPAVNFNSFEMLLLHASVQRNFITTYFLKENN